MNPSYDDDFLLDQLEAGVEVESASVDEDDERGIGGADGYIPRLTCPSKSNKYYLTTAYGGYNSCVAGKPAYTQGSALANCVGYSWGRAYENLGSRPKLSRANAENWWGYTKDGYERGQTPRLGAIACWRKGKAGDASDGAGHVAVVEEIAGNKVKLSNSGYNSSVFYLTTYDGRSMSRGSYTFQGYIYVGNWDEEKSPMTLYNSGIVKAYSGGKDIALSEQKAAISGHSCNVYLAFKKGSLSSGDTITVQVSDKFKPAISGSGCGYWSKSAFIAQINTDGKLTIRNTGGKRTFAADAPLRIALDYLID